MMDNVVHMGDFAIARKRENSFDVWNGKVCPHKQVELDDHGQIVKCTKCGEVVSAYWYLQLIASEWGEITRQHEAKADELKADLEAGLTLQAARRVEQAWRRRSTMPACPHCHRGISQHDRFGASCVSREMENRRRAVEKAACAGSQPKGGEHG